MHSVALAGPWVVADKHHNAFAEAYNEPLVIVPLALAALIAENYVACYVAAFVNLVVPTTVVHFAESVVPRNAAVASSALVAPVLAPFENLFEAIPDQNAHIAVVLLEGLVQAAAEQFVQLKDYETDLAAELIDSCIAVDTVMDQQPVHAVA